MKSPTNKKWELTKSEQGANLAIFNVRFDYQKDLRNGKILKTTVLEANDSANVVIITKDKKVIMVKQFRFGILKNTLEIPGGFIDDGEDHKTAAIREVREETGYTAPSWEYLGAIQSNPVFMDSVVHHWLATDAACTHAIQLDEGENIEIVTLGISEVIEMVRNNTIQHPHTLTALSRVFSIWDPLIK